MSDAARRATAIVVYVVTLALAAYSARDLETSTWYELDLSENNPITRLRSELRAAYPSQSPIGFFVPIDDLATARELDALVGTLPGISHVASPFRVTTIAADGDALVFEPLDRGDHRLGSDLAAHPIYRELFRHGEFLSIWAWSTAESSTIADSAAQVLDRFPETRAYGTPLTSQRVNNLVLNESVIMFSVAVALILILQSTFAGSFGTGLLLTFCTVAPSVWVVGLMRLVGARFGIVTMMAPLVTAMLSTTYSIHSYEFYVSDDRQPGVHPAILAAAATTLIGFGAMTISAVLQLRTVAWLLVIGVALAFVNAQFLLPMLVRANTASTRTLPIPRPFAPRTGLAVTALLVLVAAVVAPAIRVGGASGRDALPRTDLRQFLDAQTEMMGYSVEYLIDLDSENEFGFVDMGRYSRLSTTLEEIKELPGVVDVVSVVPVLAWINGLIEGDASSPGPRSEVEIAEALSFLPADGVGFGQLVDPGWSRHRIIVRASMRTGDRTRHFTAMKDLRDQLQTVLRQIEPDWTIGFFGQPTQSLEIATEMSSGLIRSLGLFFVAIGLFFLAIWRNLRDAVVAASPAAATLAFLIIMLRTTDIQLGPTVMLGIITIIGVSVDDGAILMTTHRRGVTTPVHLVIQTTVILVVGFSTLFVSGVIPTIETALVAVLGFSFSTMFVLFVMRGWMRSRQ